MGRLFESVSPFPPPALDYHETVPYRLLPQIRSKFDHTCVLDTDGRASCWGSNNSGQLNVPQNSRYSSLSTGYFHTCGLLRGNDNMVECWGGGAYGASDVPFQLRGVCFHNVKVIINPEQLEFDIWHLCMKFKERMASESSVFPPDIIAIAQSWPTGKEARPSVGVGW